MRNSIFFVSVINQEDYQKQTKNKLRTIINVKK